MRKVFVFISLALSLISCGDAGTPSDAENLDGEQCAATWWYLEQDGEIVLEGNKAGFTSVPGELYGTPGVTYSQGYFADSDPALGQGCTFLSKTQLAEGIHDNLTCSIATEQGPNPQWIGAESGSDGDHRPILASITYDGDYVGGVFEGTMFRLDTLSVSPPNIEGKIVNYRFIFNALNENNMNNDEENICSKDVQKCYDGCNLKFDECTVPCKTRQCFQACADVRNRCYEKCRRTN